jgi:uncharacterized membrane protein
VQYSLMTAISFHVLAATFWAGSTFALAGMDGSGSERLFRRQMVAAAIVILSGGYLWHTLHHGVFETMEKVLGVGIASALVALALQVFVVGSALGKQRREAGDGDALRARIAVAHRLAAGLLALAALCMAAARYA